MTQRFDYVRAESVLEAVRLLNQAGVISRPLAGGTDLVILSRAEPGSFDRVVDITLIPEMHAIRQDNAWARIGAGATFSEVIESPLLNATAPVLVQACRRVGAVQIRNMGTLGGNVCNAAACADSLPALVCLNAIAEVRTPEGMIEWPVAEVVTAPNRTRIPAGGLLVALRFAIPAPGSRSVFIKLGRRNAMAISRLTLAALGRLDPDGCISEARVVPGSATPKVVHFTQVEQYLVGKQPGEGLFQEAGELAIEEMAQLAGRRWSSEFKEPAISTMLKRALRAVFTKEENNNGSGA